MLVNPDHYRPLDCWDAVFCLALTASTIALFLYFQTPPSLSDQMDYFYHAAHPDELRSTHRHLRIGLILPTWLAIQAFGYSELGYYAIPALGSLLLVLGTWLIGRMLFSRCTGAFAALLIVYNPWVLSDITDLLPDYLSAGLFTVAMGLLLWCWRTGRLSARPTYWATLGIMTLVGFLLGWCYLTREYVVILFPVVMFIALAMRGQVMPFIAVASGAAACWFLEIVWGFLKYSDPLARLHSVASPRSSLGFVEMDIVKIVFQLPLFFVDRSAGLIFVFLLVCGFTIGLWHAICGDRRWQVLMCWFIGGWLFFTVIALLPVFLLGEERVYLRMHKFRYWALILPPALIAGVAGSGQLTSLLVTRLSHRDGGWYAAVTAGIAMGIALSGLTLNVVSEKYLMLTRSGMGDYAQFREFMRTVGGPGYTVLIELGPTHVSAVASLPIYLNTWNGLNTVWKGRVVTASTQDLRKLVNDPGQKLVAIDLTRAEWLERKGWPPDEVLSRLEQAGEKIFGSSGGRVVVYRLAHR
jgi:hypothetical protein